MHPQDGMGWSWEELQATPPYVRQFCTDMCRARNNARNNASGG